MKDSDSMKSTGILLSGISFLLIVIIIIVCGALWGYPQYKVYQQGLSGLAKLKEAESSRQILIQEAHAKMESAKLLAEAEVERARGVAKANEIIGQGLKDNDEYLRYLWIMSLEHSQDTTVIYIPTETNLPILEAGRGFKNHK